MAANFSISDSESEPSEEVEEGDDGQGAAEKEQEQCLRQGLRLTLPELPMAMSGRIRLNSESHALAVSREEEFQARVDEEVGTPTDGAPFRGRSKSAPPVLWAAKKYGRQLRRMSDEFDSLMDKGFLFCTPSFHPFSDPLILTRVTGGAGAYPSCLWAVGGGHPEPVASQSQGTHRRTILRAHART
ncbi:bcl2-associated agonist of cell death isoform X2 [Hippocampus comes]|uniref:bcl2-associated agonist of cell death isoform X2 n=1 Tax=Hippocampus comes TaxID=109280 RepID=UPI00094E3D61|nr:PREDICTED: bcl2-associated agonist of cell death isoform X2 [Hippocampus comes]